MTSVVTFRRYQEEDRDAVWSVFAATTAQLGFHHGPWDDDMRTIAQSYLAAGGEFLVGEIDGRIVAHAAFLSESQGRAAVKRVAVHPHLQRQAIGQALMAALEDRAREQRISVLHLDTSISQIAAQLLYRKCGYVERGRVGLSGMECLLYEKQL